MSDDLVKRLRDPWFTNGCEAYQLEAANRIEELEAKLAKAVEALDKIARLSNGEKFGNSNGNMITRITLVEIN